MSSSKPVPQDYSATHKRCPGPQKREVGPCENPEWDGGACLIEHGNRHGMCSVCKKIDNETRTRAQYRAKQQKEADNLCRVCDGFAQKGRDICRWCENQNKDKDGFRFRREKKKCPGLSEDEEGGYPAEPCGEPLGKKSHCKACKTKWEERVEAKKRRQEQMEERASEKGGGKGKSNSKSTRPAPY
eukprot:g19165.t1